MGLNARLLVYPRERADWLHEPDLKARAEWNVRGESATDVARRTAEQLARYDEALGDHGDWEVLSSPLRVRADADSLIPVVERALERDAEGDPVAARGYWFSVFREGPHGRMTISVHAGATVPGRHRSSNSNSVVFDGPAVDGGRAAPTLEFAATVFDGIVDAWDPPSAGLSEQEVVRQSHGRGPFAPIVGRRVWLGNEMGRVTNVTTGVSAERSERGTRLVVDDTFSAAAAAAAVLATFESNGIPRIPGGLESLDLGR